MQSTPDFVGRASRAHLVAISFGLTLGGTNTFTGNTLVSAGTLERTDALALQKRALDTSGAGSVTVLGGTTSLNELKANRGTGQVNSGTILATKPATAVIPATSGVVGVATITVTPGIPDDLVTDTVKISIPKSEAGLAEKLFGRLQIVK
jgi:hypothetical protein